MLLFGESLHTSHHLHRTLYLHYELHCNTRLLLQQTPTPNLRHEWAVTDCLDL